MPRCSQQQGSKADRCDVIASGPRWVLVAVGLSSLTCETMAGPTQQLSGSAVIRSLRRFRDRYFTNAGPVVEGDLTDAAAEPHPGFLDSFPVSESHLKVFGFSSKTMQGQGGFIHYVFIS